MNRTLKVTRLHLNKYENVAFTPLYILATVMVVSIVIQLAIQRATGMGPGDPGYVEEARWNQGSLWALPGFLVYYGVQAVATTYPFALALGTARRNFISGTFIANLLQSAYTAVLMLVLLWLELVTDHWFVGVYVLDTHFLGNGNPLILLLTAFIGVMACLSIGGLFGAVWVRFGSKGPMFLGIGLGLAIALTLLIIAPRLGEIFSNLSRPALALGAVVAVLLALVGTFLAMRRASVR